MERILAFFRSLITRHRSFKTYGGHVGSNDVQVHETWWRIFSREKHSGVRKL